MRFLRNTCEWPVDYEGAPPGRRDNLPWYNPMHRRGFFCFISILYILNAYLFAWIAIYMGPHSFNSCDDACYASLATTGVFFLILLCNTIRVATVPWHNTELIAAWTGLLLFLIGLPTAAVLYAGLSSDNCAITESSSSSSLSSSSDAVLCDDNKIAAVTNTILTLMSSSAILQNFVMFIIRDKRKYCIFCRADRRTLQVHTGPVVRDNSASTSSISLPELRTSSSPPELRDHLVKEIFKTQNEPSTTNSLPQIRMKRTSTTTSTLEE